MDIDIELESLKAIMPKRCWRCGCFAAYIKTVDSPDGGRILYTVDCTGCGVDCGIWMMPREAVVQWNSQQCGLERTDPGRWV